MSSIVGEFDPTTSTSETFAAPASAINGATIFFNESLNSLKLTFANGDTMYLPAWYHRHKCGLAGSVTIDWEIHTVLATDQPPTSKLIVESFRQGEAFPADGPLVRQTNGSQTATVSNATSVTNTGFAAGTSFITAAVVGEGPGEGPVGISNNGVEFLGDANYNGQLELTGTDSFTTFLFRNALQMQNGSAILQFSYDQQGNLICANGQTEITFGSGSETHIRNLAGSDIVFLQNTTETGRIVNNGNLKLTNGTHTFIASPAIKSVNGATAGSVTMYQYIQGNGAKATYITLSGYTPGASAQTIVFPVPYTFGAMIVTGDLGNSAGWHGFQLLSSASPVNFHLMTSLSSTGGGVTTVSTCYGSSYGEVWNTGFDTLSFPASALGNPTGSILITGV